MRDAGDVAYIIRAVLAVDHDDPSRSERKEALEKLRQIHCRAIDGEAAPGEIRQFSIWLAGLA